MTRTIIFLISLLLTVSLGYTQPITTPANLGSLDTLSKFSAAQRKALLKEEISKMPLMKNGENKFLDLITDPRVIYSSYFGGDGYDCSYGITVDSKENIYLVGYSGSTNLPTTAGCFQKEKKEGHDAFIAKFTPDGQPIWITYYGGSGTDVATGCVIDKDDNIYIVGKTNSVDLPVTDSVEQRINNGGIETFLLKFDENGKIVLARYYGGTGSDIAEGIALKSNGNIVITGGTTSIDLPVKSNPYQEHNNGTADVFVAEFDKDFSLVYSTYFGGYQYEMAHSIAIDNWNNVAIVGETKCVDTKPNKLKYPVTPNAFQKDTSQVEDGIITMFDSNWKLIYSTIYGGHGKNPRNGDGRDFFNGATFDNHGYLYICGYTSSYDFSTTPNEYKPIYDSDDAFILKFDGNGNRVWATLYGGKEIATGDGAQSISYNNGFIFLTGWTNSVSFPVIGDSIKGIIKPGIGGTRIILVKMKTDGILVYSGFYGSGLSFGYSIFAKNNKIYFTGECSAYSFPTTLNAIQTEKLSWNSDIYTSYYTKIDLKIKDSTDTTQNNETIIYPNPFNETINVLNIDTSNIENIRIVDLLGKTVFYTNIFNRRDITINTQIFAYGFYYLIVQSENKLYYYKMIKI